eukprot:3294143-Pleurochrysis_carterae.AAC.3
MTGLAGGVYLRHVLFYAMDTFHKSKQMVRLNITFVNSLRDENARSPPCHGAGRLDARRHRRHARALARTLLPAREMARLT